MRLYTTIFFLFFSAFVSAQNKHALLVAVGQYPQGAGLPPVAAVNDIKYFKAVLNRNGFADKNITTLINAKATKDAILQNLTSLAARTKTNDIVFISFGCHGQQIRDQRTFELGKDEDDGYDEALLPFDAKGRYNPTGYRGEKHLRDDDLYPKLLAIRKKAGPRGSVLVLIDACHSGTGTRAEGFATVRGEPVPFPDPDNPVDTVINLADAEARQGFFEAGADSLSNMVVISGSAPHQENKQLVIDHEDLGSLSYAFFKAMSEMAPGNNYGLLFEKIKALIQGYIPDQVPVFEGNPRQMIFSGSYTPMDEKIFLRAGMRNNPAADDSLFVIQKGKMDDLKEGATCRIYVAGSSSVYTEGVIRKVETFRSIGIARKLLKRTELYELKLNEEQYADLQAGVQVKFQNNPIPAVLQQVREMIQPYRSLRMADNAADFQLNISQSLPEKKVVLTDRNNQQLWSGILTPQDSFATEDRAALLASIRRAIRIRFLRTMPDGGDLATSVQVKIETEVPQDSLKGITLNEGDRYSLRLRNNGPVKLFYTVLDIYPDNRVEVLYPGKGKEPSDYIADKQSVIIRKLVVSKGTPPGREFLKVIVSKEPLDLRSVIEQTAQRDELRSFQLVLDDLFNEADMQSATRADLSAVKAEEIGIVTVHFTIRKQ